MSIEFLPPSVIPSEPAFTQPAAPPPPIDCIANQIRHKIMELGREHELSFHDREDLAQDAWVMILTRWTRYNPTRSSPKTFTGRMAEYWQWSIPGLLRKRDKNRPVTGGALPEHSCPDGIPEFESRDSVREIISRLPDELKLLAMLLGRHHPAEVARILGVSPSTVSRLIQKRLRDFFENPCNKCGDPAER